MWDRVQSLFHPAPLNAAHPCTLNTEGHLFPALQRICTYKSALLSCLLRTSSEMDFGVIEAQYHAGAPGAAVFGRHL